MLILTIVLAWLLAVTATGTGLLILSARSDSPRITRPVEVPATPEEPTAWLDSVTMRKLVIHTVDDRSIEGLLATAGPDGLLLVHAKLLGDKPVDLGGQIWIDRSKVLMVQTVPVP